MVIFGWLEEITLMREELKSAAMDYGELFMMEDIGTAVMLKLFVSNLDYTNHTQVSNFTVQLILILVV